MEYFHVCPIGHCSFIGFSLMAIFIYWSLAMPIFELTITYNTNKNFFSHLTHSSLMSFIMKNHGIFRAKPCRSISYFMRLNYIQFSDLLKNRAQINHLIWFGWVFRKLNGEKPCTNIFKRIWGRRTRRMEGRNVDSIFNGISKTRKLTYFLKNA